MSIRKPPLFDQPTPHIFVSIFGAAVATPSGGFWTRLAVSPPRSPPTNACKYAPLPPEFHLEAPPASAQTATQIDSVFPSWMHRFDDAALVTFHQQPGVTALRASPRLECTNMVQISKVFADSATWRPLACNEPGKIGHLFTLVHAGLHTCKIEATVEGDEVIKLVIVQPQYSPISVAAKMVPCSSLLIFEDVRGYIDSLRDLKRTLLTREDTGYLPVQELVATRRFGNLVLQTDHSRAASDARRHFKRVQALVLELSSATADCVDVYNRSELHRVGQCLSSVEDWRKSI